MAHTKENYKLEEPEVLFDFQEISHSTLPTKYKYRGKTSKIVKAKSINQNYILLFAIFVQKMLQKKLKYFQKGKRMKINQQFEANILII